MDVWEISTARPKHPDCRPVSADKAHNMDVETPTFHIRWHLYSS